MSSPFRISVPLSLTEVLIRAVLNRMGWKPTYAHAANTT